jgi:O-antigen/teichoic acid export membrane protein
LTTVYLARVLGAEGFGMYGFVGAVSAYFILFSNFGIEQYSAQQLSSRDIPAEDTVIEKVIGARLLLSSIFVIVFLIFGIFYSRNQSVFFLFVFQSILIIAFAFNLQFYFVAANKIRLLALLRGGTSLVILFGAIVFITESSDLPKVTLISGMTTLVFFLWSVYYVFSHASRSIVIPTYRDIITLLKNAAPLGISALMIQIYHSADIVFLGFTNPGIELGYYTGAYRIINVLSIVPGLWYLIYLPELAKISKSHFSSRRTKEYIVITIGSGIFITAVCYIFSIELITMLLGKEYIPAKTVFNILLVNTFMIFVNVALAHLLIAWNHHKNYLVVVSSGAIANIVGNIMLIPSYGIIGAAIATVSAEVVVFGTTLYYHQRLHGLFAQRKEMT